MSRAKEVWREENRNIIDLLRQKAKQIPQINGYLLAEEAYLQEVISKGDWVLDFGCGNGRHLNLLKDKIGWGLGVDVNPYYLEEASNLCGSVKVHFEEGDIEAYPSEALFDVVFSMYNTFGNIENQRGLCDAMMQSLKPNGKAIISVFSEASIAPRLKLYEIMGFDNLKIEGNTIITEDGFRSECFSGEELRALMPDATIEKFAEIGWMVVMENIPMSEKIKGKK